MSSDKTLEIIKKSLSDKDILISEPDEGIYDAINKGIKQASGDIIGILHSDDNFYDANVLSSVAEVFKDTRIIFLYSDLEYINEKNQVVRNWKAENYDNKKLLKGWMPPHPTLFVRKELFDIIGLYSMKYNISSDYDFIIKALKILKKNQIAYIPHTLVQMKTGGISNNSFTNIAKKMKEDYQIIKKNDLGGLRTLFLKNVSKIRQFTFK